MSDEVNDLVREIARSAVWNVLYYEERLGTSHEHIAVIQTLVEHCIGLGIDIDAIKADPDEYSLDDSDDAQNARALVQSMVAEAFTGLDHHADQLKKSHAKLAAAKALMLRCGVEIDFDQLFKEEAERLNRNA